MRNDNWKPRKIGLNKGKRRIWIEGAPLEAAGMPWCTPFTVVAQENRIDIIRDHNGPREISGKAERPVLDVRNESVAEAFGPEITHVTMVTLEGIIVFRGITK